MPQTPHNSDGATALPSENVINISPLVSHSMTPFWPTLEGADLAKRHRLSLLDRSPPPGTLSAELLGPSKNATRRNSVLSDVKYITETLSDVNSFPCHPKLKILILETLPTRKLQKRMIL